MSIKCEAFFRFVTKLQCWPYNTYILLQIFPAATVNISGKKARRIRSINYIWKVKHTHTRNTMFGSTFLRMHLMISSSIEKFNIHQIFSAYHRLKIGQRYHKLETGHTISLLMWPQWKSKALANQLMSVVLVNHYKNGRQQGWDQNNSTDGQ